MHCTGNTNLPAPRFSLALLAPAPVPYRLQFGGSAAAAAKAGLGPIKQFNNSMGDMMETVGGAVLPTLTVFVGKITNLFKRFDALSISTKKNILRLYLLILFIDD